MDGLPDLTGWATSAAWAAMQDEQGRMPIGNEGEAAESMMENVGRPVWTPFLLGKKSAQGFGRQHAASLSM